MFKGSLPALVTPFTPDGELDMDTLKKELTEFVSAMKAATKK